MENVLKFPQTIKSGIAFYTVILLLVIHARRNPNTNSKEYMHSYVHCSIIYNNQDKKAIQGPTNMWVDKKMVVYIQLNITYL